MRAIKEGNIVQVCYCDGVILNDLKVLHVPVDIGDLWHFQSLKDGTVYAQNPVSSNFDTIVCLVVDNS